MADHSQCEAKRLSSRESTGRQRAPHVVFLHRGGEPDRHAGFAGNLDERRRRIQLEGIRGLECRRESRTSFAELRTNLLEFGTHRRFPVPASALNAGSAPSLDGLRHDRDAFLSSRLLSRRLQRLENAIRSMTVDDLDGEPHRFEFSSDHVGTLQIRDLIRLTEAVAVEDGDHRREAVVGDEVRRFPDLTLAALTVADDAEDPLVDLVEPRRDRKAGGDRETLPQRTGGRIEERESLHGIRMAVDHRIVGTQRETILPSHRPQRLARPSDRHTNVRTRGVDDRDRVPLAEHQPIRRRISRVVRKPLHVVVHQHGHEVTEAQCRRRMSTSGRSRHVQGEKIKINGLGVNCCFEGHSASFWGNRL